MTTMTDAIERFEEWADEHQPDYLEGLAPGLSREGIQKLCATHGVTLPDDVLRLYTWRDGDPRESGVFVALRIFLSLEGAFKERELLLEWSWMEWPEHWLPVFRWDNGFHLCVDLGEEHYGCIVEAWTKQGDCAYVAPNLAAWFAARVDAFEQGLYVFQERGHQWSTQTMLADRDEDALLRARAPGYPIGVDVPERE